MPASSLRSTARAARSSTDGSPSKGTSGCAGPSSKRCVRRSRPIRSFVRIGSAFICLMLELGERHGEAAKPDPNRSGFPNSRAVRYDYAQLLSAGRLRNGQHSKQSIGFIIWSGCEEECVCRPVCPVGSATVTELQSPESINDDRLSGG